MCSIWLYKLGGVPVKEPSEPFSNLSFNNTQSIAEAQYIFTDWNKAESIPS